MTTSTAVLERPRQPLQMVDLEIERPRAGEVVVEMGATGVCHSDISVQEERLPSPLPVVLGHEGAGTVVEVGDGVVDVRPGDRVVLSWLAQCRSCFHCLRGQPSLCEAAGRAMARGTLLDGTTRLRWDDRPVYQMAGLGTFAHRCVVPAAAAIRVPESLGMAQAALLGCGVLTGFGAAVNTARVQVGDTVAVIGCGGVGLNAVQGARISGARTIIAIDRHAERLRLAEQLGATAILEAGDDVVGRVRDLTEGRGVDVAVEVVGTQETVRNAVRMTRRGGQTVLVGAAGDDVTVSVPAFTGLVMTEKVIRGSLYGSSDVRRDVARLVGLYEAGLLLLDALVSATFPFEKVNEAVAYCASERGARAVVLFETSSANGTGGR
jgi:alcohol dehydrogenase/S-(hydroxymethyl)glutathione dehydrogenase/alcohol dehydrogenase